MSNRIFSIILFCFCFVASYAQSQCDILLDAARKYKNKGEYEKAVDNYDRLEKKCPNYFTETVRGERSYCKKKLGNQNKPAPQKPSNQTVSSNQQSSSQTISTPQSVEDQLKTVKVSFEPGKATPTLENERVLIKELQDNDSLDLEIEVPWCRNMYSKKLIGNRIQNLIDFFVASGIEEERITASIILVDVEDDYLFLLDYQNSEEDKDERISEHIILINAEDGYDACDSAWLKTEENWERLYGLGRIHDWISRLKITFRDFDFRPQIVDNNDGFQALSKIVNINREEKKYKLLIEGYTSAFEQASSSEKTRWELALRRVNIVRELFIQNGVDPNLIGVSIKDVCWGSTGGAVVNVRLSSKDYLNRGNHLTFILVDDEQKEVVDFFFSRIYFEEDSETPIFDNEKHMIIKMLNEDSLSIIIALPWCKKQYDKRLIDNRIKNISNLFTCTGVDENKWSIILIDAYEDINEECDGTYLKLTSDKMEIELPFDYYDDKILFDYDEDTPKNIEDIESFAERLRNTEDVVYVYVSGYDSEDHSKDYLRNLSTRRANKIRDLFIRNGVNPNQIRIATYTIYDFQHSQNVTNRQMCSCAFCKIIEKEEIR